MQVHVNVYTCTVFLNKKKDQEALFSILQVQQQVFQDKYMGLPTLDGRMHVIEYDRDAIVRASIVFIDQYIYTLLTDNLDGSKTLEVSSMSPQSERGLLM
jgi:hypothetical protein